jgi:hypothetical protein
MPQPRFTPRKRTAVPIVWEARWVSELVWRQSIDEKSFASAGNRTMIVRSVVRFESCVFYYHGHFFTSITSCFFLTEPVRQNTSDRWTVIRRINMIQNIQHIGMPQYRTAARRYTGHAIQCGTISSSFKRYLLLVRSVKHIRRVTVILCNWPMHIHPKILHCIHTTRAQTHTHF